LAAMSDSGAAESHFGRRDTLRPTPQVLAIAGTGQNGATLLCRLLGQLPGYVAVGEIGRLWHKGLLEDVECSCGERFSGCPFWTEVGTRAFGGWDRLDADEARRLVDSLTLRQSRFPHPFALPLILLPRLSRRYARDLRDYSELIRKVDVAVLDVSGATVVVDSMKIPAHVYLRATSPAFRSSVVQLVRDPRGVAFSNTKLVERQGSRSDKRSRTQRSPTKSATKWLWFNLSFELLRAWSRAPWVRVRYEELVRDPAALLRAVVGDIDDAELNFIAGESIILPPGHLVAGNRMRRESGTMPLRIDEEWRRSLPATASRTVSRIARPLMRRYGYESRP
jgi:hypothetical protein